MSEIVRKVQENGINSRMTKRSVVVSYDGTQQNGSTVYIGAPSSDFRIRIYDKALEEGEEGHWVRVEMVMRGAHANAFVAQAIETDTIGRLAAQVLNDKFAFIEKDDSNITRCTVCDWWERFVDELQNVHLVAREVVKHTVERISNWVEFQVGPSLAVLCHTKGFQYIRRLARQAERRMSDQQRALIKDYNAWQAAFV